jgi:thiamine-monophosphate kinase
LNREDDLLEWLRRQQPGARRDRPGDDAAILGRGRGARALTADQQIAGVHVPPDLDPGIWARRLLAVNLSDLAAMGARPMAALLTVAVPAEFPLRTFLRAAIAACGDYGIPLAGGDIARSPCAVTTMTLVGRLAPGGKWLRRAAARPGDRLWLGAGVGVSALGQRLVARGARLVGKRVVLAPTGVASSPLASTARQAVRRHLAPAPQLDLGLWLSSQPRAAAIDVSDGLSQDLHRLCRASGVGAVLDLDGLPRSPRLESLAAELGAHFPALALAGGEDYVLLFALGPRRRPPARFGALPVGRVIAAPGIWCERQGALEPLTPEGWDHLAP